VVPADRPKICVWTAPATPTVHKSEFDMFMVGVIADGGGDFNVVTESEVDLTVLSVLDSVTIGCAAAKLIKDSNNRTNIYFIIVTFSF
jgi:hypothetical protein